MRKLDNARIAVQGNSNAYTLEARVPLEAIGLEPQPSIRLRIDWGILVSGKEGNEVLRRIYWSNKMTQMVSDAPSEMVLRPDLRGVLRLHSPEEKALDKALKATELTEEGEEEEDRFLEELGEP